MNISTILSALVWPYSLLKDDVLGISVYLKSTVLRTRLRRKLIDSIINLLVFAVVFAVCLWQPVVRLPIAFDRIPVPIVVYVWISLSGFYWWHLSVPSLRIARGLSIALHVILGCALATALSSALIMIL